ncbi:MAG: DUF4836 family protein [Taibaiella sp.]|jgi:hypothetical protein
MQKVFRFIPIIVCMLFLFSSCSKPSENSRYISKDAIGVLSINTSELVKKVAWSALSGSPIFKDITGKAGGDSTSFDIEKTGIDIATFFAYALPDQRLASKSKFMVIIPLKDAAKFQAFVKEKFPKAKIETKDNLTFAVLNENTTIGWDKKTAIAAAASPKTQWSDDGQPLPSADNTTILMEEVQKTFALKEDQSLAANNKFTDLQKAGHDIGFWLNYEALATSMPQEQIGSAGTILASQKKLLKDAFIAGGVDFEKGKIAGDATYYFNPSVKAIAEAMESKSVNNDLLKRVPGTQMNLMMSYHFNPQGIKAVVDTMGVGPLANAALKEYGLTIDDILNAFTGDFLLAVTDFAVSTESKSYTMNGNAVNYTSPVPTFKASLSFKIKDKAAFDKVMQVAVTNEMLATSAPGVYTFAGVATLASNGEYAAISNDPTVASAFLVSPGNANFNVPAEVKNNPYGFFADIKNSIKSVPLDLLYGKEDTAVFHDARNLLESISAHGGKVKDSQSDFHFEVNFQNKEENSLMQIINFSQKVAEAEKRQADSFDEVIPEADTTEVMVDTAAAI